MEAHQQYEDSTEILISAILQPWCHNLSETSGQMTKNLQFMTSDNKKSESCEGKPLKESKNISDKKDSEYKSDQIAKPNQKTRDEYTKSNVKSNANAKLNANAKSKKSMKNREIAKRYCQECNKTSHWTEHCRNLKAKAKTISDKTKVNF